MIKDQHTDTFFRQVQGPKIRPGKVVHRKFLSAFIQRAFSIVSPPYCWKVGKLYFIGTWNFHDFWSFSILIELIKYAHRPPPLQGQFHIANIHAVLELDIIALKAHNKLVRNLF